MLIWHCPLSFQSLIGVCLQEHNTFWLSALSVLDKDLEKEKGSTLASVVQKVGLIQNCCSPLH